MSLPHIKINPNSISCPYFEFKFNARDRDLGIELGRGLKLGDVKVVTYGYADFKACAGLN